MPTPTPIDRRAIERRGFPGRLPKRAAPLGGEARSKTWYHGTPREEAARGILANGIQPREVAMPARARDRHYLAPARGRVYLTTDLAKAAIYALGGDFFGTDHYDRYNIGPGRDRDPYGYIFEVDGRSVPGDVLADEDDVGGALCDLWTFRELSRRLADLDAGARPRYPTERERVARLAEIARARPINRPEVPPEVAEDLLRSAMRHLTEPQKRKIDSGELAHQAMIGKKLQKRLRPETTEWLLGHGANAAHLGPIFPVRAWRFRKSDSKSVPAGEALSISEEIPVGRERTAGDFGYSSFRDRSEDLSRVRFEVLRNPSLIRVSAYLDRESGRDLVGRIDASAYPAEKIAVVGDVEIERSWRGTGLGQTLYDKAIAEAKRRKFKAFASDERARRSEDAERVWRRLAARYPVREDQGGLRYVVDLEAPLPVGGGKAAGKKPVPVLFLVHPGSACGSADMNLGSKLSGDFERRNLARELDAWRGGLVWLEGSFDDELDWPAYRDLGMVAKGALARARAKGLPAAKESAEDPDQEHVSVEVARRLGLPPDTPIVVTGCWLNDQLGGCVGSVIQALRAAGYRAEAGPGAVYETSGMTGEGGDEDWDEDPDEDDDWDGDGDGDGHTAKLLRGPSR